MQSSLPKVMHQLRGRPMLEYVASAFEKADLKDAAIVVSPAAGPSIMTHFSQWKNSHLWFCEQPEARGSGDAVASVADLFPSLIKPKYGQGKVLKGDSALNPWTHVLISPGDVPLIKSETLDKFVEFGHKYDAAVLACRYQNPFGYGRILQVSHGEFAKIVEEKDATPEERQVTLCNTGLIFANARVLFECLEKLAPHNVQGEYYLTDVLEIAKLNGRSVGVFVADHEAEFAGINDQEQLRAAEQVIDHMHL